MLYAQEFRGQKLHLVAEQDKHLTGRPVSYSALCGRTPHRRGWWRMTINMPLAHACKNCCRIWDKRRRVRNQLERKGRG